MMYHFFPKAFLKAAHLCIQKLCKVGNLNVRSIGYHCSNLEQNSFSVFLP